MGAVSVEIAEKVAAITHGHVDIDPGVPVTPLLPEIPAALDGILEDGSGHLDLRIDAFGAVMSLAYEAADLVDAVLVEEVAHVRWAARNGAAIEDEIGLRAAVHLLPTGRQHVGRSFPTGFQARTHDLDGLVVGRRFPVQQRVAGHVLEAIVAEAVAIRGHVAAVPDVVVMDAVDGVMGDQFFDERQQPLVGVAGEPGRAHPDVVVRRDGQLVAVEERLRVGGLPIGVELRPFGMLAEGNAVFAFVEIDQPDVDFDALVMSLADQVFHQVEIAIARRDELREALAVPDDVAAALLAAHHELVDVGALELRDEGADGIDGGAGVGSAGPHGVSLPWRGDGRLLRADLGKSKSAGEGGGSLTASQLHDGFTTGVRASTGGSAGKSVNGEAWYQ